MTKSRALPLVISGLISILYIQNINAADAAKPAGVPSVPDYGTMGVASELDAARTQLKSLAGVRWKTLQFETNITIYLNTVNLCNKSRNLAVKSCDDNYSSILDTAAKGATEYGNLAVMGASALAACAETTKYMKQANTALIAFKSTCSKAGAACGGTCGQAYSAAKKIEGSAVDLNSQLLVEKEKAIKQNPVYYQKITEEYNAAMAAVERARAAAAVEVNLAEPKTAGSKQKECSVLTAAKVKAADDQLAFAGLQMLNSANCEKNTNGTEIVANEQYCSANPTDARCNCGLSQHASTLRCICERDPRNVGCANGLTKVNTNDGAQMKTGMGKAGPFDSVNKDAGLPGGLASDLMNGQFKPAEPKKDDGGLGAGGAAGAPLAGGAGAGSGNKMDSPNAGSAGAAGDKISSQLGGWGGGSGGGGGGAMGAGGAAGIPEEPGKKGINLAQYLPGQKLDPTRKISGTFGGEITGQGKSNWEKVKTRYQESTPTLLGGF